MNQLLPERYARYCMNSLPPLRDRWHEKLEKLRLRLSSVDALPQLALLGIISGLLAGGVVIAFRYLIEAVQHVALPAGQAENYEGLTLLARFLLAVSGALVVGIALQLLKPSTREVGVVHVMERLAYHQGHLPLRNAVVQFLAGAASIISGHSVGREGPGVHLGAASWASGCTCPTTASVLSLPAASRRLSVHRSIRRWPVSFSPWKLY